MHSQTCHSAEQRLPITQYQTHGQKPQVPPQAHCSLSTKPSQVRYAIYKLQNLRLTRAFPHLKTQHPNPFNNRLHLRLFHTSHLKPNSFPQHPKVLLRIPLTNAEAGGPQTQGRWRREGGEVTGLLLQNHLQGIINHAGLKLKCPTP